MTSSAYQPAASRYGLWSPHLVLSIVFLLVGDIGVLLLDSYLCAIILIAIFGSNQLKHTKSPFIGGLALVTSIVVMVTLPVSLVAYSIWLYDRLWRLTCLLSALTIFLSSPASSSSAPFSSTPLFGLLSSPSSDPKSAPKFAPSSSPSPPSPPASRSAPKFAPSSSSSSSTPSSAPSAASSSSASWSSASWSSAPLSPSSSPLCQCHTSPLAPTNALYLSTTLFAVCPGQYSIFLQ